MNLNQVDPRSFLKLQELTYLKPRAASTSFVVASVDPSTVSAGAALTLQTRCSEKILSQRIARRPTITVNDDDGGGGLTCTVLIKGYRHGFYQEESITATSADTNDTTVVGTKFYDEFLAPLLISKTADTGDALLVGVDADAFGLPHRIAAVESVKSIVRKNAGTEADPVAISSTSVDVTNSAIVQGTALDAADDWCIVYEADGNDGWQPLGAMGGP